LVYVNHYYLSYLGGNKLGAGLEAILRQLTPIILFPLVDALQVIPSLEYAKLFVPSPPATQRVPFHAIANAFVLIIVFPLVDALQVIPSLEYAKVFVP
jgi:Na+/phosphate symporter